MSDDRQFATAKMDKPIDASGKVLALEVTDKPKYKIKKEKRKRNYRKVIYPIVILLIIIHWIVATIFNMGEVLANSIKELALSLQSYINNADNIADSSAETE